MVRELKSDNTGEEDKFGGCYSEIGKMVGGMRSIQDWESLRM